MTGRTRTPVPVPAIPNVRGSRHGLDALKSKVALRGLGRIDKRTAGARDILKWRRELVAEHGGPAAVTASMRGVIEIAVRTRLLIDHVDGHWLAMPRAVNRRNVLIPLVEQRQRLVDSYDQAMRRLDDLASKRRAGPSDLATLLAQQDSAQPTGRG
jgi:hypothetical protein